MGFSLKQLRALRREVDERKIRTRQVNGRDLSYIEGWHAIAEANRIFGFDGWTRETVETRCVIGRETRGTFLAVYTAKVRVTVFADGRTDVREGHGTGESHGTSPGESHDLALKAAETDATKRALATFGKPFGLSLYLADRRARTGNAQRQLSLPHSRSTPTTVTLTPPRTPRFARPNGLDQGSPSQVIDKSVLALSEPRRVRDRDHVKSVAKRACLICGRRPSDAHHLRFAQHPALGRKVSDEFTVPLCRGHHREVHRCGNEADWWRNAGVDPIITARALWLKTHPLPATWEKTGIEEATSPAAVGTDQIITERDQLGPANEPRNTRRGNRGWP